MFFGINYLGNDNLYVNIDKVVNNNRNNKNLICYFCCSYCII